jgi:formamidopyrimidine-DNA glycosylase
VRVRRRAKYLLVDFTGGGTMVVHLGMTGQLGVVRADAPRAPHTHVVLALDHSAELRFVDPRRFGNVLPIPPGKEHTIEELRTLGVEPFELTAPRLHELARGTRRAMKLFLLDQTAIAGLGNIYVSEALYHARIHPGMPANRLSAPRAALLRDAIIKVLTQGLENRGTTLRDYVDARGAEGGNQHHLAVYGRDGEICPSCGGKIRRVTTQARATFYCPKCQKR